MRQREFEQLYSPFWAEMKEYLENGDASTKSDFHKQFPRGYRRLSHHLALAKSRQYSIGLIEELNDLVLSAYLLLYGKKRGQQRFLLEFLAYGFPAALRSNSRFLWLACAVFVLPFAVFTLGCYLDPELIYSVMQPAEVRVMESMYDPDLDKLGRERQSDTDVFMFGFYIMNNIGIAFRCFATGIFFGIGSLFVLAYNGLVIGAVQGHLLGLGYGNTFLPFVIGHGSFELIAIVFSGAAGLKLGFALLSPGALSRRDALIQAARDAIRIMYGVFLMLMIAAFIEAFWSSTTSFPISVKFGVGAALWVLVIYYCFFFARDRVRAHGALNASR